MFTPSGAEWEALRDLRILLSASAHAWRADAGSMRQTPEHTDGVGSGKPVGYLHDWFAPADDASAAMVAVAAQRPIFGIDQGVDVLLFNGDDANSNSASRLQLPHISGSPEGTFVLCGWITNNADRFQTMLQIGPARIYGRQPETNAGCRPSVGQFEQYAGGTAFNRPALFCFDYVRATSTFRLRRNGTVWDSYSADSGFFDRFNTTSWLGTDTYFAGGYNGSPAYLAFHGGVWIDKANLKQEQLQILLDFVQTGTSIADKAPKDPDQPPTEPEDNFLRRVDVSNARELSDALNTSRPGDRIVLASGTYSGDFTAGVSGNATNPIRIEAAAMHGATMTGRFFLNGSYTIIRHLRWGAAPTSGNSVVDINGNFSRCEGCLFDGTMVSNGAQRGIIRVHGGNGGTGGNDTVVRYNEIRNFRGRGICVRTNTGDSTSSGGPTETALRAHIYRNYVHSPASGGGFGTAAIAAGGDNDATENVYKDMGALIEYNLIERMTGGYGGLIQSKGTGNTIQFNTGRNNLSRLEIREGRFCDVIANALINSLGPVCHGEDNRLIGNYNDGQQSGNWYDMGPMGGVADLATVTDPSSAFFQDQAYAVRTLCAGNIGTLRIGGGTGSWRPALDTIVEEHNGTVLTPNAANTTYRQLTVTVPAYVILQPSDVGPAQLPT
jgi:hypothetical protein